MSGSMRSSGSFLPLFFLSAVSWAAVACSCQEGGLNAFYTHVTPPARQPHPLSP